MIRQTILASLVALALPVAASARVAGSADAILDALHLDELLAIMAEESRRHGADLDMEMLDGRGGEGWRRIVTAINDPEDWRPRLRDALERNLADAPRAEILDFFTSSEGQRIVALEIDARRAMLDADVEAESRDRAASLRAEEAPLIGQIERFVTANDLIDANVVGSMNANIAFLDGFHEGSGTPVAGDPLDDVWSQEAEIRASTTDWVYAFLTLAYSPLAGEDLDRYIAFSESDAGEAFNAALFAAFDRMFYETSYATGRALGRMAMGEDL